MCDTGRTPITVTKLLLYDLVLMPLTLPQHLETKRNMELNVLLHFPQPVHRGLYLDTHCLSKVLLCPNKYHLFPATWKEKKSLFFTSFTAYLLWMKLTRGKKGEGTLALSQVSKQLKRLAKAPACFSYLYFDFIFFLVETILGIAI